MEDGNTKNCPWRNRGNEWRINRLFIFLGSASYSVHYGVLFTFAWFYSLPTIIQAQKNSL